MKQDFTLKIPPVQGYGNVVLPRIKYSSNAWSKIGAILVCILSIVFATFAVLNYVFYTASTKHAISYFLGSGFSWVDTIVTYSVFFGNNIINSSSASKALIYIGLFLTYLPFVFAVFGFASNRAVIVAMIGSLIVLAANIFFFTFGAVPPLVGLIFFIIGYFTRANKIKTATSSNNKIIDNIQRESFIANKSTSALLTSRTTNSTKRSGKNTTRY